MGTRRQGERLGQSRRADGGTYQGVDAPVHRGDGARERGPQAGAAIGPGVWAERTRGSGASCRGGIDSSRAADDSEPGSAGFLESTTLGPRLLPFRLRSAAAAGLAAGALRSSGRHVRFRPPRASGRRILRQSARRRPALGPYAAPGNIASAGWPVAIDRPAPRLSSRFALFPGDVAVGGRRIGVPAAQAE
jgi:hypothetical protein